MLRRSSLASEAAAPRVDVDGPEGEIGSLAQLEAAGTQREHGPGSQHATARPREQGMPVTRTAQEAGSGLFHLRPPH
jgi:hypothetical protein